jgi:hypothetical protein
MEPTPANLEPLARRRWFAASSLRWLFDAQSGPRNRFVPRWIFLRALAAIYFSAFLSLLFQIEGLIGPRGVLPARRFLSAVGLQLGTSGFWYAPTLFWISSGEHAMMIVVWLGMAASIAAFCNLLPRLSFFVCFVCFLSFIAAAEAFSSYQSDGMLLEAGFLALFFAPRGLLPGWGIASPPSRASLLLLQWEWFRIYFESGIVKLLSGESQWRNFTAMDEYYQNGPLPTWIGWYLQHLPHWFHAASVAATLGMELAVVWMLFLPRRARLICFFIVTPWEISVILTANYAFLNYLVLALGLLLLDDRSVRGLLPSRFRSVPPDPPPLNSAPPGEDSTPARGFSRLFNIAGIFVTAIVLSWIAYATTAEMILMAWPDARLPSAPISKLEPFRIANQYGLFAVMTRGRYEIEFQGSNDGQTWTPYQFRFKPQALNEAPGIYAPYQPRFEWNLWFASLGDWRQNDFVPLTEERILDNDSDVLALFKDNPFPAAPPRYVRAVLWQYWFTSMEEKRHTGNWWKRDLLGLYAPVLTRDADGKFAVTEWPDELPPHD